MIRPIVTTTLILARPSTPAVPQDAGHAQDLLDTFEAHRHECVGMAANMIGILKRIIVFDDQGTTRLMFNPEIVDSRGSYPTEEGCLSLTGTRPTTRYRRITVRYQDADWIEHTEHFSGYTAEIIQHEIDHCDGVVI